MSIEKKNWPRHTIQALWAALTNSHISGFVTGKIYTGKLKNACVPGLNCYSCPGAAGACPIGSLQAVVGSWNLWNTAAFPEIKRRTGNRETSGGRAAYLMYGTEIAAGHHNSCFDFDEKCLYKAVAMLTELAIAYTNK